MPDQISAPSPLNYVALGDSIATGANNDNQGFPIMLQQKLNAHRPTRLTLLARNGQTSRQLLKSLPKFRTELSSADLITLVIGGNDLRLAWRVYGAKRIPKKVTDKKLLVTLNTLTNNWNEIINHLKTTTKPRTQIILFNLYNPFEVTQPETREFINLANAQLQNLCRMHNIDLINVHALINKKPGKTIQQYLSSDNLHLNQRGQEALAQVTYRHIHPLPIWKKLWHLITFNRSENI